jgi:hypothetical protein
LGNAYDALGFGCEVHRLLAAIRQLYFPNLFIPAFEKQSSGEGHPFMRAITLRNRIYYGVKPLLPSRFRLSLRRWFAGKQRKQVSNIWPVAPGSEQRPSNWSGWPHGKTFAFVLTHDVEGPKGLAKCRQLMQREMELGFRSSINFIPEAFDYRVPVELREELVQNGFEVGVHDLHHDGKLYRTRREFLEKAGRINQYLKEWKATGFRSGFMHHNLDWLHDLNIVYDASTFDTDPFEPQPDGLNTIFPAWIYKPERGSGYVELPYTLPQDSTVFILLEEKTCNIWKRKLDWIVKHGGMALVNSHPDYMVMSGAGRGGWEYPIGLYEEFLKYVSGEYSGAYWHALPGELASYWKSSVVQNRHSKDKIKENRAESNQMT